jgi:hypothetical protein
MRRKHACVKLRLWRVFRDGCHCPPRLRFVSSPRQLCMPHYAWIWRCNISSFSNDFNQSGGLYQSPRYRSNTLRKAISGDELLHLRSAFLSARITLLPHPQVHRWPE